MVLSLFVLYTIGWVAVFGNSTMLMPLGNTEPGLTHKQLERHGHNLGDIATDPLLIMPHFCYW